MKNLKNWNFLIILFLTIAIVQSCEKDDVIVSPDTVKETKTDTVDNTPANPDSDESETPPDDANTEDGEGAITLYRVDGDNLIKEKDFKVTGKELEFQKDTKKHQEIWELTKKIVPPSYRSKMSRFMIFIEEKEGIAGYVIPTKEDLSTWEMGINIDLAYYQGRFNDGGDLAYTIIHEFGHILTLNDTQLDTTVPQSSCKQYYPEGCSKKESHINKLYNLAWADIWDEFLIAEASEYQDPLVEFYEKYKDRFVTWYASTNPGEDIAEVFATFVTRNEGVRGKSIAEQKIQLMYDSKELVDIRTYIKGNSKSSKSSYLPVAGAWKRAKTFGDPKKIYCTKHKR